MNPALISSLKFAATFCVVSVSFQGSLLEFVTFHSAKAFLIQLAGAFQPDKGRELRSDYDSHATI